MQKVSIYIFEQHIADMYQDGNRVYLKQIDDTCHKVSPSMLNSNQKEIDTTHLVHLERVAGFISDSLPGNFGNEIFNNFFLQNSNKYPTVSDKLLFIGNRGLGAITYEPSVEKENDFEHTIELKSMFEKAKELKKGGDYHSLQDAFLISAHSFVGGARSKAVGAINLETKKVFLGNRNITLKDGFIHAIIKYDDTANENENKSTYSKVEYIYYLLAIQCGIDMTDCYLVEADGKHHFVTKRFDIKPNGKRYHIHSDDHSRNFSFMCDRDFKYKCTPAYDLTFEKGEKQTVEHQLSLYGKPLSLIDIDDITTLATEFSIDLEFVAISLETMKQLRDNDLPKLLKKYDVKLSKQKQILEHTQKRTLQGALV